MFSKPGSAILVEILAGNFAGQESWKGPVFDEVSNKGGLA